METVEGHGKFSLGKPSIDIGVNLRDATRGVNGDDRGLMVVELSERSHDDDGLELFQARQHEIIPLKMGLKTLVSILFFLL